ncbi:MAG: hypothetical protein JSS49_17465 [Planctomycetes bacterium]|nr:hypothetical protein [Planctomycetota bacterium]
MTYVDIINALELVWWPIVGLAIAWRSRTADLRWQRLGYISAGLLVWFGLSDGVELYTKAWWNPWWLLVWKGLCITGLVASVVIRFRWLQTRS